MLSLFNTIPTDQDIDTVAAVLRTGQLVMGKHVEALEEELADYLGAGEVVTCASGTDALTLALEITCPTGDYVLVPAMTFSATYEAVIRAGYEPICVDVEPETGSPSVLQYQDAHIEAANSGKQIGAMIVVHLYGQPVYDLTQIRLMCQMQDILLIEDCAQAFGASVDKKMMGTWGDAAAFSFYPTKPLGGIGDGGAAWFPDKELADEARARRNHGRTESGQMYPGYNSRLDEANAAVLRDRLSRYGRSLSLRRELDLRYHAGFGGISFKRNGCRSPYVYPILVDQREAVRFRLADIGVETRVHYDPALSELRYTYQSYCPNAAIMAKQVLSLPCHEGVTTEDVDRICDAVREVNAG